MDEAVDIDALRRRISVLEDANSALIAANKELGEQAAYARREALACKNREYDLVQKLARTERRMAGVRPCRPLAS